MKIRALIVDDEPLAREGVRIVLAEESDVEIVAECADGAQAVKAIEEHRPDLVFLDVQMPHLNGFDVLAALDPSKLPAVIFTTAHDQHAIAAFEINAVDYLLKPFKPERLRKAVERARQELKKTASSGPEPQLARLLAGLKNGGATGPRILIRSPEKIVFLRPDEIDHIEAAGNYLVLHAGKERHIARETMTAMEARLASAGFMRISRSIIINLGQIRELAPMGPGEYCVILKNGGRFDMTCSLSELQDRLGKL
jgi:two-component system LytT family response regulator